MQSGSQAAPEVILIPWQNAAGQRNPDENFIILLCKSNLCDKTEFRELQHTQKMISTQSLSFDKPAGAVLLDLRLQVRLQCKILNI